MVIRFCILIISLSVAYSCKTTKEVIPTNDSVVFAGTFVVNTLYDQPIEGDDFNLKINDRTSEISGLSGCNTYSVTFTTSSNNLTFSFPIGTKIYCNKEVMKKESEFLNIFASPKEFHIEQDTLTLYDIGKEVLKATRFTF